MLMYGSEVVLMWLIVMIKLLVGRDELAGVGVWSFVSLDL
jgi:hypothetical protein